jgi:ribonuclease R
VRAVLRGELVDRSDKAREALRAAATTCSENERKAMEIEREVVDLHRALLMRSHIGRIHEGTVTGLVGTGVFVNVDDPFVDVLVRMESLGADRYELDEEHLRVIGARSGDRIALGDRMLVEIEDVSILRRTVYGRRVVDAEERRPKKPRREVRKTGKTAGSKKAPARKKGRR